MNNAIQDFGAYWDEMLGTTTATCTKKDTSDGRNEADRPKMRLNLSAHDATGQIITQGLEYLNADYQDGND